MRIVFMGTGEIAEPCLRALLASAHELCAVVTQPDRPVGRHQERHEPMPKVLAAAAGVPVLQPERLRGAEEVSALANLAPDLIVVMAYGQILPRAVLELPKLACINVHASLLPRHRGASCIQAAIAEGDATSGVTIIHVAEGLDTGDIILQRALPLRSTETAESLHDRLAEMSPALLLEAVALLEAGTAERLPQEESQATYAPKLRRDDGRLDWTRPAAELERRIRAYHPWPGTAALFTDARGRERRLKVFPPTHVLPGAGPPGSLGALPEGGFGICCGEGLLQLADVQADGGRRMSAEEFAAGHFGGGRGQLF